MKTIKELIQKLSRTTKQPILIQTPKNTHAYTNTDNIFGVGWTKKRTKANKHEI